MATLGMMIFKMLAGAVARDVLSTRGQQIGPMLLAGLLRGLLGLAVMFGAMFLLLAALGVRMHVGAP
jgi:hypothetical protein